MQREHNLNEAVQFILNSVDKTTKGSRAFYSRIFYPSNGWSNPYPETTGYIIPTLFELSLIKKSNGLFDKAIEMAEWIISLQNIDGSLPGGVYKNNNNSKSIFNTAQMIKGLYAAWNFTKDEKYLTAAFKAGKWLADSQDFYGIWNENNYYRNFFPSYYTSVAWPMLLIAEEINDNNIMSAGIKTLKIIAQKTQNNKFVKDSGFKPNHYAFLHTIAYTIEGFLESSKILNSEEYFTIAFEWAFKLCHRFETQGKLAGAYYEDFKEIKWYRCLTGESQMAIIWIKIFELTNDLRFMYAASRILDQIARTQPLKSSLFLKAGGLKGSHPYYGRYIIFRQPNWATKFFIDAILLEDKHIKLDRS